MANLDFNKPSETPKMASARPVRRSVHQRRPGDDPATNHDPNSDKAPEVSDDEAVRLVSGLQRDHDATDIAVAPDEEQDAEAEDDSDEDDTDEDDDDEFDDDEDEDEDEDGDEADEKE